jgi:hypothetical protein
MRPVIITFTILVLGFSGTIFSQENGEANGGADSSMMKNCPMMMGKMLMPQVVATFPDGGIIVMSGNKLLKYDKDLKLQKETVIPIDSTMMK